MTTRDWLRQNGYEDVVGLIDEVMATLTARGSKERRNWWDVLAGGKGGKPSVVGGREFPVLRVAQARQGKPISPNAISRSDNEQPPDLARTGRWPKKRPRKKRPPAKVRNQTNAGSRRTTNGLRGGSSGGRPAALVV